METEKNNAQTIINTAEKDANTASTGALSIATTTLGRAWKGLTEFMKANEFALIAAGVSLVVYALYRMYKATKDNSNGWKEWDKIQQKIDDDEQKMIDKGNQLINVMTSENSTLYEKIRAYQKLKSQYPELFKNMKEENALAQSGAYWQEKLGEAIDRRTQKSFASSVAQAQANAISAHAELKAAQEEYNKTKVPRAIASVFGKLGGVGPLVDAGVHTAEHLRLQTALENARIADQMEAAAKKIGSRRKACAAVRRPYCQKTSYQ